MNAHADSNQPQDEGLSLAELFHLVSRVAPAGQELCTVEPDTHVADAIALMLEHQYSQLPVMRHGTVLGVFCYRSFARKLLAMGRLPPDVGALPVDEFMEKFHYVQGSDTWESTLEHIEQQDAVLVGQQDSLQAIVTSMDVVHYLRAIANPFVMLAEIELSLRGLIQGCANGDQLRECIARSLPSKYQDALPTDLREMSFEDYVSIVTNGDNWPLFSRAFGKGDWARQSTAQRLKQVREIRNIVFHFRRELTPEENAILADQREWLQNKMLSFTAAKSAAAPGVAPKPKPKPGHWSEESFLLDLGSRCGDSVADVAQRILQWSKQKATYVWWGRGAQDGSFVPVWKHKGIERTVFAVYSYGRLEVYFQYMRKHPPFDDVGKRRDLLQRLNAIHGISLPEDGIERRPRLELADLAAANAVEPLLEVFDWVVAEIQAA